MNLTNRSPFALTRNEMMKMTDDELAGFQRSLGQHLGTGLDSEARRVNNWINEEKVRRTNYGF